MLISLMSYIFCGIYVSINSTSSSANNWKLLKFLLPNEGLCNPNCGWLHDIQGEFWRHCWVSELLTCCKNHVIEGRKKCQKIFRSKNFYFNHTYNKLYTSTSRHVGETAICLLLNTMLWKKYCWKTTRIIMTTIHSCFIAMVYRNLRQAYLLEVGLTQIPSAHAPSSTSCHVGRHVGSSSTNFF